MQGLEIILPVRNIIGLRFWLTILLSWLWTFCHKVLWLDLPSQYFHEATVMVNLGGKTLRCRMQMDCNQITFHNLTFFRLCLGFWLILLLLTNWATNQLPANACYKCYIGRALAIELFFDEYGQPSVLGGVCKEYELYCWPWAAAFDNWMV